MLLIVYIFAARSTKSPRRYVNYLITRSEGTKHSA
jgi:hypothetical protein